MGSRTRRTTVPVEVPGEPIERNAGLEVSASTSPLRGSITTTEPAFPSIARSAASWMGGRWW